MLGVGRIRDRRCMPTRRALSAALDGEATVPDLVAAARHLGGCPRCRRFATGMAAATSTIRATSVLGIGRSAVVWLVAVVALVAASAAPAR
jgi:hypothetical protein